MGTNLNLLRYGSKSIEYKLVYTNRKSLGIIVKPDLNVIVRAPLQADISKIEKILKKKAPWIIRNVEYFESLLPKPFPRSFISGESHFYLGRHYRLKVYKSKLEEVYLKNGYIKVYTNFKSNPRVIQLLLRYWYKIRADRKFKERLEHCFETFKNYYHTFPHLESRVMKLRWGSCNTTNKIILNQELIKTSTRCIDYVIMHELCHLVYRNHNHQFYLLLSKVMPDWKQRKFSLEKSINKL